MTRLQIFLFSAVIVVLVGLLAWSVTATSGFGSWTGGSPAIIGMIALGVLGVGALTGVLMWLAFYSARKGYDDRQRLNVSQDGEALDRPRETTAAANEDAASTKAQRQ